jgi:hypothetical protein
MLSPQRCWWWLLLAVTCLAWAVAGQIDTGSDLLSDDDTLYEQQQSLPVDFIFNDRMSSLADPTATTSVARPSSNSSLPHDAETEQILAIVSRIFKGTNYPLQ